MRTRGLRALLCAFLGLLCAALLSGCISVPTSGTVKKVEGAGRTADKGFEIEGQPPRPGDQPKVIVDGFLQAMASYQAGYPVARQYLTKAAAESWRPEDGVAIYTGGPPTVQGDSVVLQATLSASLGADKAYTQRSRPFSHDFRVVKQGSEWRISNPPDGLILSQYKFNQFYRSYNLYFFDPQYRSLVPDPIFLPREVPIESALVQALLRGPTDWLKPSVVSVIPPKTSLSVQSVSVTDGVAEVNLSDDIMPLTEDQRSLMAAQVIWTLRQVDDSFGRPAISGVRFRVNGTPYPITKDQLPGDGPVPIDALDRYGPVPGNTSLALYGVTDKHVVKVDESKDPPQLIPVPGPLGQNRFRIDDLAVSGDGKSIAVVTNNRTMLRSGPAGQDPVVRMQGASDVLRPQFSRYDELWAIGRTNGRQGLVVIKGDKSVPVDAKALAGSDIRAFKIAPDGVRIALIRQVGNRSELGLARITRADSLTVDGWRAIKLTGTGTAGLSQLIDVSWVTPTTMMILGAGSPDVSVVPIRLDQDASQVLQVGLSDEWDAVALATSAAATNKALVLGRNSRSWRFQGEGSWPSFSDKLSALAYPG
ncbi:hypothetical protein GCM10009841_28870 [Microlunatus panaciterrae]|uniref:GerMN domain-containing protein n=1 Tax=Microlunatus panaciterrae TaxID=400768 RepID=A0ABS2RG93_9ACTN|nr:LpqB family beta-propeller domain-containing protein [Microlunatus panaciterrae]MBM7797547.1 hypothetical protein [Microlunatus panaciterrae]